VNFSGWTGACSGTSTTCNVTVDGDKTVTATFASGVDSTGDGGSGDSGSGSTSEDSSGSPSVGCSLNATQLLYSTHGIEFIFMAAILGVFNICLRYQARVKKHC